MSSIEVLVENRIEKEPALEIFSIEYDGRICWVKRARKTGSNLLQRSLYGLTQNALLVPVENKDPEEALKFESSKLQELYTLSVPVPKVIEVSQTYFVLEDAGPTVRHLIKHDLIEDPPKVFEEIIAQLAALHNLDKFHGGPQIKNVTYKDKKISFIDFEESFDSEVDIKDLQFRDLFLFLFSLSKTKREIDYKILIKKYIELTDNKDVIQRFHQLASNAAFLMKIVKNRAVWNIAGRDVQSIYRLLEEVKNIH